MHKKIPVPETIPDCPACGHKMRPVCTLTDSHRKPPKGSWLGYWICRCAEILDPRKAA